ncbi:uncharacterized protein LOC119426662 [Nematolebias whitei]|uniref:uncharacterized protein LOC119426662 n=1 Tax=Nematolebias whitei TaxID=451745 RepID=UPI0018976F33|nr:uncharacterized protein LOC119426662 [Nematolebias whitei]
MEEAMSHTAHSRNGTDDRVKLPNLTDEEVNWQALEDLYSINESLYECRPDYSPSPDNWANFQKDADKMFALRHVLNKNNRTQKLDNSTLPELGSGAGGGGLEDGSGEELASTSVDWPDPVATPVPSRTPPAPPTPGEKLHPVVNDLPERTEGRLGAWSGRGEVAFGSDTRQLEEMEGMFSGNGMTELEAQHDGIMRTHTSLQAQLKPEHEGAKTPHGPGYRLDPDEEDIFQAQVYIPLSPQSLRLKVQTRSPAPTQTVGVTLNTPTKTSLPLSLDCEGSGSQPSSQIL